MSQTYFMVEEERWYNNVGESVQADSEAVPDVRLRLQNEPAFEAEEGEPETRGRLEAPDDDDPVLRLH